MVSLRLETVCSLGSGWVKFAAGVKWSSVTDSMIYIHGSSLPHLQSLNFATNQKWVKTSILKPIQNLGINLSSHSFRRSLAVNIRRQLIIQGYEIVSTMRLRINKLFNWSEKSDQFNRYSGDVDKYLDPSLDGDFPEITDIIRFIVRGFSPTRQGRITRDLEQIVRQKEEVDNDSGADLDDLLERQEEILSFRDWEVEG